MAVPENEAAVRRQIELLDAGDTPGSAACFAEHGRNHGMEVSRDQVEVVLRSLIAATPDAKTEILGMISDGDVVSCRTRTTGTHLGTPELPFVCGGVFAAGPPTGAAIELTAIHWYRMQAGQIVEHFANRDDLGVARQLGLVSGIPSR